MGGAAKFDRRLDDLLFIRMVAGTAGIKNTLMSDDLKINGSRIDLIRFFTLIEKTSDRFPIVTP